MHEHDRCSLGLGQLRKGGQQSRLEGHFSHLGRLEDNGCLSVPSPALTHPIEESERVDGATDRCPVLPGVGQCFSRGLAAPLGPVGRDKRPPKSRLGLLEEQVELRLWCLDCCLPSVPSGELDRRGRHPYHAL
jgi:hypothetical protein